MNCFAVLFRVVTCSEIRTIDIFILTGKHLNDEIESASACLITKSINDYSITRAKTAAALMLLQRTNANDVKVKFNSL